MRLPDRPVVLLGPDADHHFVADDAAEDIAADHEGNAAEQLLLSEKRLAAQCLADTLGECAIVGHSFNEFESVAKE